MEDKRYNESRQVNTGGKTTKVIHSMRCNPEDKITRRPPLVNGTSVFSVYCFRQFTPYSCKKCAQSP
ncbi:hypothetical protein TIFTF001_015661 [Ficus carica]|uniref:Uncharacterized protein n=1 Tax=Ficus carica TaxID=3494 RepID=A0AA88A7L7_FICCA|nr:hypothetical protein TIFTF001_015661 [Ficus carica]